MPLTMTACSRWARAQPARTGGEIVQEPGTDDTETARVEQHEVGVRALADHAAIDEPAASRRAAR